MRKRALIKPQAASVIRVIEYGRRPAGTKWALQAEGVQLLDRYDAQRGTTAVITHPKQLRRSEERSGGGGGGCKSITTAPTHAVFRDMMHMQNTYSRAGRCLNSRQNTSILPPDIVTRPRAYLNGYGSQS